MNKAKDLLVTTNDRIYQIAEKVGLQDARYFSELFKKVNGISPGDFRIQSSGKLDD